MNKPPDLQMSEEQDRKMMAAAVFVRRCGAQQFQLRYSDDEEPVVWMAIAKHGLENGQPIAAGGNAHYEVAASVDPLRAVLRLCERLADGGQCTHCGRMTGLEPDELGAMPLSDAICWYVYDPGEGRFRRGCEGLAD
jgi:hypothetical protein